MSKGKKDPLPSTAQVKCLDRKRGGLERPSRPLFSLVQVSGFDASPHALSTPISLSASPVWSSDGVIKKGVGIGNK
jgi:hypothetical protein